MVVVTLLYLATTAVTWTTSTSGYAGVPLHGRPQDVLYSIGQPDLARGSASEPWRPVNGATTLPLWFYRSPGLAVRFDQPNGRVAEIYCENVENVAGSCPGVLGLNIGDHEQDVLAMLGTPRGGNIARGRRVMSYNEAGYEFSLARLRVRGIRFSPPSATPLEKFARYFTWLIP